MRQIIQKKILLTILGIVVILGGTFFLWHTAAENAWASFRNHEPFYAETPIVVSPASAITSTMQNVVTASTTSDVVTTPSGIKVPILVFHIVRPSYPTDSQAVKNLAQTPEIFDAEMKYLQDSGYHVIAFRTLIDYLKSGTTTLPVHPIVITFDDGWGDQFKYAFPILEKYHYTATFFIFTNPVGTRGFVTWDDLRALRDAGMDIGSHSRSHPFLTKITDPKILWNEIHGSKLALEKNLNITVTEFAYPFGKFDATTTDMVKKAGYTSARGDVVKKSGFSQPADQLYDIGALNAPVTLAQFVRRFPVPTK